MINIDRFLVAVGLGLIVTTSLIQPLASTANQPLKPNSFPTRGKVLKLTSGDLMCYVDLIGAGGKKYHLAADFEICNQTKLINRQVKLTYEQVNVNNCQSNEMCGESRTAKLVVKMKLVSAK
jgi:hypothetical protein